MKLFHYTCSDGFEAIRAAGWQLRPNVHPALGHSVVWLTTLSVPDRFALGLTSYSLNCDRTESRLTIADDQNVWQWWRWCRDRGITRRQRDRLELAPGARPLTWWVSEKPLECVPVLPSLVDHFDPLTAEDLAAVRIPDALFRGSGEAK